MPEREATIMARNVAGPFDGRSAGVLLHLTSVPGAFGIGDLGPGADAALAWIQRAGLTWWQMLPVGPIGPGDSPYASTSSFAGEPLLVGIEGLVEDGLLPREVLTGVPASLGRGSTRYADAAAIKYPLFVRAWQSFKARGGLKADPWKRFVRRNRYWLPGWRAFTKDSSGLHAFLQFQFARQWSRLRAAADSRGIRLLGDVPIFVAHGSADVRDHPELFRLAQNGDPTVVTGVPPDQFSATGQRWGHPHYRWSAHRRTGFAWWIERMRAATARFDAVRIDHFIGLHHAYEIPATSDTAMNGTWHPAPGDALLTSVRQALGGVLPVVAEDLGSLTPGVVALRDRFALPGMRLLQDAFSADDHRSAPHWHPRDLVCYPGTHDNPTTIEWWAHLDAGSRARARAYMGWDGLDPAAALVRLAFTSPANTAIATMQDLLGLGPEARMNLPGTVTGNWHWRLQPYGPSSLRPEVADRIRALASLTGRLRTGLSG
jgi:4-alpha-glucanotransferase